MVHGKEDLKDLLANVLINHVTLKMEGDGNDLAGFEDFLNQSRWLNKTSSLSHLVHGKEDLNGEFENVPCNVTGLEEITKMNLDYIKIYRGLWKIFQG